MPAAGVAFINEPRLEPGASVAVLLDIAANRWDPLVAATGRRVMSRDSPTAPNAGPLARATPPSLGLRRGHRRPLEDTPRSRYRPGTSFRFPCRATVSRLSGRRRHRGLQGGSGAPARSTIHNPRSRTGSRPATSISLLSTSVLLSARTGGRALRPCTVEIRGVGRERRGGESCVPDDRRRESLIAGRCSANCCVRRGRCGVRRSCGVCGEVFLDRLDEPCECVGDRVSFVGWPVCDEALEAGL